MAWIALALLLGFILGATVWHHIRPAQIVQQIERVIHQPSHITDGKPGIRCHICAGTFNPTAITFLDNGYPVCMACKEKMNG